MIAYAQVNEDNRVERAAWPAGAFTRLACIAGSGERLIAMLDLDGLETVTAIDIQREALFLLELKLAALQNLPTTEYLAFAGFQPATPGWRQRAYNQFSAQLSMLCRAYWDRRQGAIRRGIVQAGRFERFLHRIRPLLRVVLGPGFFRCLDRPLTECPGFPKCRWALVRRVFSWRASYWLAGNVDPAFTGPGSRPEWVGEGLDQQLRAGTSLRSFMFHLIFYGHLRAMAPADLPPSVQVAVLERIRERLRLGGLRIEYVHADALAWLQALPEGAFAGTFFSLSDLLSFENQDYLEGALAAIDRAATGRAGVFFRAFLRRRPEVFFLQKLERAWGPVADFSAQESTGMYQAYFLNMKTAEQWKS